MFGLMLSALLSVIVFFLIGKLKTIADEIGDGFQGFAGTTVIFIGRYLGKGAIIPTLVAAALASGERLTVSPHHGDTDVVAILAVTGSSTPSSGATECRDR